MFPRAWLRRWWCLVPSTQWFLDASAGNICGRTLLIYCIAPLALLAMGVMGLASLLGIKPQASKGVIGIIALLSLCIGFVTYVFRRIEAIQVMVLLT
ncbi:hypothetical protein OH492_08580 [Vibrio chagasii]|nr:hypothetical protein [Vibrio chagasii]